MAGVDDAGNIAICDGGPCKDELSCCIANCMELAFDPFCSIEYDFFSDHQHVCYNACFKKKVIKRVDCPLGDCSTLESCEVLKCMHDHKDSFCLADWSFYSPQSFCTDLVHHNPMPEMMPCWGDCNPKICFLQSCMDHIVASHPVHPDDESPLMVCNPSTAPHFFQDVDYCAFLMDKGQKDDRLVLCHGKPCDALGCQVETCAHRDATPEKFCDISRKWHETKQDYCKAMILNDNEPLEEAHCPDCNKDRCENECLSIPEDVFPVCSDDYKAVISTKEEYCKIRDQHPDYPLITCGEHTCSQHYCSLTQCVS